MQIILGILFLVSIAAELIRLNVPSIQKLIFSIFGSMMRKDEQHKISGWSWIIGSAFLCSLLFHEKPYISFIALSLFILGDAAAAIIGISVGRLRIGQKTLEGSLACFFMCLALYYIVFPFVPQLFAGWESHTRFYIGGIIALFVTIFELIPLKIPGVININDNLAVPVIAGYIIIVMEKIT